MNKKREWTVEIEEREHGWRASVERGELIGTAQAEDEDEAIKRAKKVARKYGGVEW